MHELQALSLASRQQNDGEAAQLSEIRSENCYYSLVRLQHIEAIVIHYDRDEYVPEMKRRGTNKANCMLRVAGDLAVAPAEG